MPDPFASSGMNRRNILKGVGALAGAGLAAPLLAACGDSKKSSGSSSGGSATGPITFGSNYSDAAPKAAFASLIQGATSATSVQTTINTTDHNTFQNNISNYLQGTPDSLATWFAGYRLQFFAAQGLLTPIDDVWDKIGGNFNDAAKSLSKGLDGHYYLVPIYNYPWVVFYNKSTFSSKGYTVPTTWDDYVALLKKMKTDGLVPQAFADKDGWPALGTFDILNLRINGYDYHIKLMKHQVPWTDPGVTKVFDQWREIMPYMQTAANGRTWQDGAKALENKQAGLMFQGSNQVAANYDPKNLDDLDFFVYPTIDTQWGTDYMDAPADGFMLPKKGKNQDAAKKVLEEAVKPNRRKIQVTAQQVLAQILALQPPDPAAVLLGALDVNRSEVRHRVDAATLARLIHGTRYRAGGRSPVSPGAMASCSMVAAQLASSLRFSSDAVPGSAV